MSPKASQPPREGGREPAEPATSGLSGERAYARNSSGSASLAASVLDLRQKVNYLMHVLEMVLMTVPIEDPNVLAELQSLRQRGFRRGR